MHFSTLLNFFTFFAILTTLLTSVTAAALPNAQPLSPPEISNLTAAQFAAIPAEQLNATVIGMSTPITTSNDTTIAVEPQSLRHVWGLREPKGQVTRADCSSGPSDPPCSAASILVSGTFHLFGVQGLGLVASLGVVGLIVVLVF